MAIAEQTSSNPLPTASASRNLLCVSSLASEVMFFAGLISAYVLLRITSPAWPGCLRTA